jgi:hypothetical protein
MKRACLLAISLGLAGPVNADSFCFHEMGMIGTKAIGYTIPFGPMMSKDTDTSRSDEQSVCRISSYDSPAADGPVRIDDCQNFQHVRSEYVEETDRIFTDEEAKAGHAVSEYFTPLVFAVDDQMAALKLKTGEMRWVKAPNLYRGAPQASNFSVYQDTSAIGSEGGVSSEAFYSQPKAGTETGSPSYSGPVQDAFLDRILPGQPHEEDALQKMTGRTDPIFTGFIYRVTDVVTASDGDIWFELEEHLALSSWSWPAEVMAIYSEDAALIKSDPIRTVYVPFKAPDGTIISLLTSGVACGC